MLKEPIVLGVRYVLGYATRFLVCSLVGYALLPHLAFAQHSTDVGSEMRDIQQDVQKILVPEVKSEPAVERSPDLQPGPETDVATLPKADEDATHAGARQTVAESGMVLTGDWTVLQDVNLFESFERALVATGKNAEDVQKVLADYQEQLIGRGYLLARLTAKESKGTGDGHLLEINVALGRYGDLSLYSVTLTPEGVPVREPFLQQYFSDLQIRRKLSGFTDDRPFNYNDFYRRLYDINMHPDLTIDTKLRLREEEQRYIDMEMTVKERLPVHAILEINNTGTESTKDWRAGLTIQHLNLLRLDDVLTLRGINATDLTSLNSLAVSYRIPYYLGNGGAITTFSGYSRIDSEEIVQDISIRGSGWFAGLQGAHRLLDTAGYVLSLGIGGVYRSMEDQLIFSGTEGRKREAEAFPFSLSFSYASKRDDFLRGRNYLTLESAYNLGAAMNLSSDAAFNDLRQNAVEDYFVQRMQVARLQSLYFGDSQKITASRDWSLFVKFEGQVADGALIPAEQFAAGGMNTVRGYDERALLGDHGGVATIELRTPILQDLSTRPFKSSHEEDPNGRVVDRLQALLFLDSGFITRTELLQGEKRNEGVSSVGLGLRWALSRYAQVRADAGYRIDKLYDQDRGVGFHLSAQIQY